MANDSSALGSPAGPPIRDSRLTIHHVRRPQVMRLAAALLVGLLFGAYEDIFRSRLGDVPSDFSQPWLAGQLLREGRNPYQAIGPHGAVPHQFHLIYPATAAVVAMPFGFVPQRAANALFVGFGAALLFWALTVRGFRNPQLLVFTAFPFIVAAQNVQWSPLLTAATIYPLLGFVYACKPSIALAYWAAWPNARALVAAAGLTVVTLVLWPWWPKEWLTQLGTVTHMSAPVTRWGGPLLLLAALRWRRPEARLLLGLSCIPQTPVVYEAVPLFLLVTTLREGVGLMVVMMLLGLVLPTIPTQSYDAWMAASGAWMIWFVYLPCLVLVLRRPNVAPAGDPVDRAWSVIRDRVARLTLPLPSPSPTARP